MQESSQTRYSHSEKGRARRTRYNHSEKGRASHRRYRQSEKGKQLKSRNYHENAERLRAYACEYYKEHQQDVRARHRKNYYDLQDRAGWHGQIFGIGPHLVEFIQALPCAEIVEI